MRQRRGGRGGRGRAVPGGASAGAGADGGRLPDAAAAAAPGRPAAGARARPLFDPNRNLTTCVYRKYTSTVFLELRLLFLASLPVACTRVPCPLPAGPIPFNDPCSHYYITHTTSCCAVSVDAGGLRLHWKRICDVGFFCNLNHHATERCAPQLQSLFVQQPPFINWRTGSVHAPAPLFTQRTQEHDAVPRCGVQVERLRLDSGAFQSQQAAGCAAASHIDDEGVCALVDAVCKRRCADAGTHRPCATDDMGMVCLQQC